VRTRNIEILVGVFVTLSIAAFIMLAMKVSGVNQFKRAEGYSVSARFDNIGGLKVRSPVKLGGVVIGRVTDISLDKELFMPIVSMTIDKRFEIIPTESSASIMTAGLLGEQYVAISPGGNEELLVNGDTIADTQSAFVLEELISHFIFSQGEK